MLSNKQRRQYLQTQVQTATREQLVLMLFDGVIRFSEQGKQALLKQDYENSHNALMRAQAIIMELVGSLDQDQGGEIAENLGRLYAYTFQRLIEANMAHTTEPIDETQQIFGEIRESWRQAMQQVEQTSPADAGGVKANDTVTLNSDKPVAPEPAPEPKSAPKAPPPESPVNHAGRPMQSRLSVQG